MCPNCQDCKWISIDVPGRAGPLINPCLRCNKNGEPFTKQFAVLNITPEDK